MDKARLLEVRELGLGATRGVGSGWDPSKEGHELAAVANAQGPGVGTVVKGLELLEDTIVEPAWGKVKKCEMPCEMDRSISSQAGCRVNDG